MGLILQLCSSSKLSWPLRSFLHLHNNFIISLPVCSQKPAWIRLRWCWTCRSAGGEPASRGFESSGDGGRASPRLLGSCASSRASAPWLTAPPPYTSLVRCSSRCFLVLMLFWRLYFSFQSSAARTPRERLQQLFCRLDWSCSLCEPVAHVFSLPAHLGAFDFSLLPAPGPACSAGPGRRGQSRRPVPRAASGQAHSLTRKCDAACALFLFMSLRQFPSSPNLLRGISQELMLGFARCFFSTLLKWLFVELFFF